MNNCFSSVAGILLVERILFLWADDWIKGFSPVAGILLVEREEEPLDNTNPFCFSPVAGILLVESHSVPRYMDRARFSWFQSRCRDSFS